MSEDHKMMPEQAAKMMVKAIKKKKTRLLIGPDAKALDLLTRIFPSYYDRIMNYFISRKERSV